MSINWFPGHMVKARREIESNLKLVDVVVIILDARAPFSCRNPELEQMLGVKKKIMVLNKMDLADSKRLRDYIKDLRELGFSAAAIDSVSGRGSKEIWRLIDLAFADFKQKALDKGRRVRPVRVMVAGVPNVGKSTFLNSFVGKKIAATGAKPGVTRGKQWVRVRDNIELLDTPGLMWPKVESEDQGYKLALLNIIGEKAYDEHELSLYLIRYLQEFAPGLLALRYRIDTENGEENEILSSIAKRRGYLGKGGQPEVEKAGKLLLQDFRKGVLGTICLD